MAACRSSLENTGKMSLIPVFNKNSPQAHTESELDVLGVHEKLVKYVVHSFKRLKKKYFSSQLTSFWSQGILGVKDRENPTWQRILNAVGCTVEKGLLAHA
jgi:hypothetical protein